MFHLFAVVDEGPVFGVMIHVKHGEHHTLHVSGAGSGEIRGVNKRESNRLAIWGEAGLHAGLISGFAVVGHEQLIGTIEVNHGNHIVCVLAVDFTEEGGASSGLLVGDLQGSAVGGLPLP